MPPARRQSQIVLAIALFLLASLSGCGGGSQPKLQIAQCYPGDTAVPATGPTVAGIEAYDKAVSALLKKYNIPGAAVAVAKNGKLILARGYGYADYENKQLMQPDSMFRIGSSSKVMTSMAILHLREEGLIDLDAKFLDVLTEYTVTTGGDPRLRDITIRELLQHSGGWDRDKTGDPMGWQGSVSRALKIPMPVMCSDVMRYMMGQPLDFAPGSKQVYSNFGYCILGRVIEKVSGEPYEIYVRNHVQAPMDIHAMSIGYGQASQRGPKEVKYYGFDGQAYWDSVFPGEGKMPPQYAYELLTIDSCGGWIGSPIDLVRLMTAIDGSRTGPYLNADSMAKFVADPGLPDWNSNQNYWYGLGIFVGPTPQTWYHGGSLEGAETEMLRDGNGYTWVIITNSLTQDPGGLLRDEDVTMLGALGSGIEGSPTDLFQQYPSPTLPARSK